LQPFLDEMLSWSLLVIIPEAKDIDFFIYGQARNRVKSGDPLTLRLLE
jgi:hypothetical protein